MRIVLTIFMVMVFGHSMFSQSPCGVGHAESLEITKRLLANKLTLENGFVNTREDIIYVPIKFHILGKTDGTSRIAESDVLEQLALLNRDYLDQDIQFYIENGFNYIDNTAAFNDPSTNVAGLLFNSNRVGGMVNIFIPLTAQTGGGNIGTTLGFYSPFNDWIVIRQAEVRNSSPTLTHEMGHLLSLLHPHNGWDSVSFLDNVAEYTPTPTFAPGGVLTENMAQSGPDKNCDNAGDFLCDTPPDYNFGFGWPDCDFTLGTLDPAGVVVDPQETLFMGYFLNCPDGTYTFSPMQKELMQVDLADRLSRNSIFDFLVPETIAPVTADVVANFPVDSSTSFRAEEVYFNWEPVDGATDYIFQVSRANFNFNSNTTQVINTDGKNDLTIAGEFSPGVDYVWRVYPFNQTSTGAGFSQTFRFTAGAIVNVETIEEISSFELFPTILTAQGQVVLEINSDANFDADIQVINLSGQVVLTRAENINSGANKINMSLPSLAQGVYFVKVQSEEGIISKKLIVQ